MSDRDGQIQEAREQINKISACLTATATRVIASGNPHHFADLVNGLKNLESEIRQHYENYSQRSAPP